MSTSNKRGGYKRYDPILQIHREIWYHGLRSRAEIVPLLQKKGDFLIRTKHFISNGKSKLVFILCVCIESATNKKAAELEHMSLYYDTSSLTWELKMLQTKSRRSTKSTATDGPGKQHSRNQFKTVMDLIKYYQENPLLKDVKLRNAIRRPKFIIPCSLVVTNENVILGRGNFAKVVKGIYLKKEKEKIPVAIKILLEPDKEVLNEFDRDEGREALMKEVKIMQRYSHRNVTKFYGVVCDRPPVSLVMEFCPGGALDSHLQKYGDKISNGERGVYMLDAARGLRYLHYHQCIHRDLAARNCLISEEGVTKIADFGLSKILDKTEVIVDKETFKNGMPLRWMAPETIAREPRFSCKSDVWSYGVLVYEIFNNGIKPWADNENNKDISRNIRHGNMPTPPERTPPSIVELMRSCWELEIDQRPQIKDIVKKIARIQEEDPALNTPKSAEFTVNLIPGVKRHQKTESTEEVLATKSLKILNSKRESSPQSKATSEEAKETSVFYLTNAEMTAAQKRTTTTKNFP